MRKVDLRRLYGRAPDVNNVDAYEDRVFEIAEFESECIEGVFAQYGIRAEVDPDTSIISRQYFAYSINLLGGTKGGVRDVMGRRDEIANVLSRVRGKETTVRMQASPLLVEVPNPFPVPVSYAEADINRLAPGQMLLGVYYTPFDERPQPVVIDFSSGDAHTHALIAGASKSGKSTAVRMGLLSMAMRTPPEKLRILAADLKARDLPPFARLPHVAAVASTLPEAEAMLKDLYDEMEWRKHNYTPDLPILVCVIDEQRVLADSKEAIAHENAILALGRDFGIHLLISTQYPTKEVLGGLERTNVGVKVVGFVGDANDAHIATGRKGTGCHLLPSNLGAFVFVDGPDVRRVQTYWVSREETEQMIDLIAGKWTNRYAEMALPPVFNFSRTTHRRHASHADAPDIYDDEPEADELDELAAKALPAFERHWDEDAEELGYGGLAAVIYAMFGRTANTGGANRKKAMEVVEHLRKTTTTTHLLADHAFSGRDERHMH